MIDLKTANTGDKSVDNALAGIEKMKVNQCFIFLLCLHRNRSFINPRSYQNIVELVEKFTYVYSAISKQPTNALEKLYSKHAKKFQEASNTLSGQQTVSAVDKERLGGQTLSSLKGDLIDLLPALSVFSDGLSNLSYDSPAQRTLIRYTFEKIEEYKSNGIVALSNLFTLDHIAPRSKSNKKGIYDSIGNLVPLSSYDNSSLGDKDPIQKLDVYKENINFFSVVSVVDILERKSSFGEDEILDRTTQIADYTYNKVFLIKK